MEEQPTNITPAPSQPPVQTPLPEPKDDRFKLGKREVIFIVILGLLLIGAGLYAWKISHDDSKDAAEINSFAECVAAGNPVMESYPEKCAAGGKTFTNPDQVVQETPEDEPKEEDAWLLYTSTEKTYTVRIPDGWDMINLVDRENLYGGRSQEGLVYKPGQQAKVETLEGGWDGASPFTLYVPVTGDAETTKEGTKQGEVTAASGQKAEKYYFVQTAEPEEMGYMKDAKVYSYYFGDDGKSIQFKHVVNPGDEDQHERVEQMISTLKIN